jgi:hypothetical protein
MNTRLALNVSKLAKLPIMKFSGLAHEHRKNSKMAAIRSELQNLFGRIFHLVN